MPSVISSLRRGLLCLSSSNSTFPRHSSLPIPPLHFLLRQRVPLRFLSIPGNEDGSSTVALLIESLGFSPEAALSVSKKLQTDRATNVGAVVGFFNGRGFSPDQICRMIRKCPRLLQEQNPERTLLPKLEFITSKGVDAGKFLSSHPDILRRSLERCIVPSFDFFRRTLKSDEIALRVVGRAPRAGCLDDSFVPNVKYLLDNGVSESNVFSLLRPQSFVLFNSHARLREAVRVVKEMRLDPRKAIFHHALMALLGMSKSTWESKARVYRNWGWSEEELLSAFRKAPLCMSSSEDKINRVMSFLVDKMGWKPSLVAEHPILIMQSLEKKTIPRASVLKFLLSEGLLENCISVVQFVVMSEQDFMKRVSRYPKEVADRILAIYKEEMNKPR